MSWSASICRSGSCSNRIHEGTLEVFIGYALMEIYLAVMFTIHDHGDNADDYPFDGCITHDGRDQSVGIGASGGSVAARAFSVERFRIITFA